MHEHLRETRRSPRADDPVHTLPKVCDGGPDRPTPALVAQAELRVVERERADVLCIGGVTDKTASSVRIESEEPEEGEVVRVPERLEALVTDLVVGRRVHEHHDEQHEVAGDAACLPVVNILSSLDANLWKAIVSRSDRRRWLTPREVGKRTGAFDVEEVDVVGGCVHHGPESQSVRNLPMEPDVFVGGE